MNYEGEDRFSELPDSLIVQILSKVEFKYAIRTGVLAKSWINIWTKVHSIILNYGLNDEEYDEEELDVETGDGDEDDLYDEEWDEEKFYVEVYNEIIKQHELITSVDGSLRKCTTAVMNRFCSRGMNAVSWMLFALDRNVKMIELRECQVPPELFQSSTITNMGLYRASFATSAQANLSSLKSLLLDNPAFSRGDSLEKLVMGCPVLENLVLDNFNQFELHVNIKSSCLKTLKLRRFEREIRLLTIEAPLLEELEIMDTCLAEKCHLVDVSSLVKTTLAFYPSCLPMEDLYKEGLPTISIGVLEKSYKWIIMATELLNFLAFVGELIVGSELIQALVLCRPSLFMCKHLSIETHIWKFDLPGIACLLENAPHLETLLIKVVPFEKDKFPLHQTQRLFHERDPRVNMRNGNFLLLKKVQIEYCQSSCDINIQDNHGGFFDYELLEYVLKSAVGLEKLVMFSSRDWSCSDSKCLVPNCSFQYVPNMCSKLMNTFTSVIGKEAARWELRRSQNKLEVTFSNYASQLSSSSSA